MPSRSMPRPVSGWFAAAFLVALIAGVAIGSGAALMLSGSKIAASTADTTTPHQN